MMSEDNFKSYNYMNVRNTGRNNNQVSKRNPTEGEIDQFIELLKNSNASLKVNETFNKGKNLINNSEIREQFKEQRNREANSSVSYKIGGALMKTVQIQSPESYLREAERYDESLRDETVPNDNSYRSNNTFNTPNIDYMRKTTFLNKNSELRVTISREEEAAEAGKSYGHNQGFDNRMNDSRDDFDRREVFNDTYSNRSFNNEQLYSRNYTYPQDKYRFAEDFIGSSNTHNNQSNVFPPRDLGPHIPSTSRSPPHFSTSRENRNVPDRSSVYNDQYNMGFRDNSSSSTYMMKYYPNNTGIGRPSPSSRSPWSRSPSPGERLHSRNSANLNDERSRVEENEPYNAYEEDIRYHFNLIRKTEENPIRREEDDEINYTRRNILQFDDVPSPPPPPILSDMKKTPYVPAEEPIRPSVEEGQNPFPMLLADRNVSISTLLEAAIGTPGEQLIRNQYPSWDPAKKMEIVSNCEEKIRQLYRHRMSGPGSFIPDIIKPDNNKNYQFKTPLLYRHPHLEFNSRTIDNIWTCPGIKLPDIEDYEKNRQITSDVICLSDDEDNEDEDDEDDCLFGEPAKVKKTKKNEKADEKPAPRIETRISYDNNAKNRGSNVPQMVPPVHYEQGGQQMSSGSVIQPMTTGPLEQPNPLGVNYNSESWNQVPNVEFNTGNPGVGVSQCYPGVTYNQSETFQQNNWQNWGGPQEQQQQQQQQEIQNFENQQLVQYPVGYQPIAPSNQYPSNVSYPLRSQMDTQFPQLQPPDQQIIGTQDQWFQQPPPPNAQNPVETNLMTVQYPVKQRMFKHSNLIPLTDRSTIDAMQLAERPDYNKRVIPRNTKYLTPVVAEDSNQLVTHGEDKFPVIFLSEKYIDKMFKYNVQIRNIQLNDEKSNEIIMDLENGKQLYATSFSMKNLILFKREPTCYKIFVTTKDETSMIDLFHEIYHDLNIVDLEVIVRNSLTHIISTRYKLYRSFSLCSFCRHTHPIRYESPPLRPRSRSRSPSRRHRMILEMLASRRYNRCKYQRYLRMSRHRRSSSMERYRERHGSGSNRRRHSPDVEIVTETHPHIDLTDDTLYETFDLTKVICKTEPLDDDNKNCQDIMIIEQDGDDEEFDDEDYEEFIKNKVMQEEAGSSGDVLIFDERDDDEINDDKNETLQEKDVITNPKEKEQDDNQSNQENKQVAEENNDKTEESKQQTEEESTKSKSSNPPPPSILDFKTRIRNVQLSNNELKIIINNIETNNKSSVEQGYTMKAGMLCKKCQIGDNNEVRIVAVEEQIEETIKIVHTMSSNHATVEKTIMLFSKHFIPVSFDINNIVHNVIDNCQICKQS